MQRPHHISTIEHLYPNQWVTIEVTRASPSRGALSGRVLAYAQDEKEITRAAVRAREEYPNARLFTFYTGPLIPEGMTVIFGCR